MAVKILIAFGANLGDRETTAVSALAAINQKIGVITGRSSLIENAPLLLPHQEPGSQPNFLNAVFSATTDLSAEECLKKLLDIENDFGRVRKTRWGARTIDLDLLAYGDHIIDGRFLTLPHPEMHKRSFVLEPLCQIDPDWVHPVLKKSAKELLCALG